MTAGERDVVGPPARARARWSLGFHSVAIAAAACWLPATAWGHQGAEAQASLRAVSCSVPCSPPSEALDQWPVTAPARGPAGELIGLYYFRARYYDPSTGRFLQRDPVWDPVNLGNQYTFAGNSPISGMDPTGEIAFLPALGLLGLGLLGGMEATGWGAAGYTGDPSLEIAPSQMLYHAATGSSVFGGSGGFQAASYSGGERVYQGAVGAASFLGGGIAGAMARGASIPARVLAADAALNVGLGAVETARGHTIMGPLQAGLGLVGLAGLRGAGSQAGRVLGTLDDPGLVEGPGLRALFQGGEAGAQAAFDTMLQGRFAQAGLRDFQGLWLNRAQSTGFHPRDLAIYFQRKAHITNRVVAEEVQHALDFVAGARDVNAIHRAALARGATTADLNRWWHRRVFTRLIQNVNAEAHGLGYLKPHMGELHDFYRSIGGRLSLDQILRTRFSGLY